MEMKLRKLWPLFGALCVTAFSSAFAQSNYSGSGSSSNSSTYGSGMDSSKGMQSGQGTYQRGTFREITPAAGPRVAHGADVFITANFIWWKANQDGLRYAASGFGGATAAADPFAGVSTGKDKSVGESWEPGFKVGLGLNLSHDGWDLFAQYTWLNASNTNSIRSNSDGLVPNYNGNIPSTASITEASGKWDLHFNVIDVELGRNFYLSQFLTMRPFIGFKGTWQDQDTRFNYRGTGFQIDGVPTPATGPYKIRNTVDVWGIGFRGGLNLAYYMAKSWSIFGNLAWTSMWSDYDTLKRTDRLDDTTTGNSSTRVSLSNDTFYSIKYVAETEIGLRWEIWFYDDNYHFAIQAGWEQQVWINWAQVPVVGQEQAEHDMTLHGLNLKFRFDF